MYINIIYKGVDILSFNVQVDSILKQFYDFINTRQFGEEKYRKYFLVWVKKFLYFAKKHHGYSFQQTLDLFLEKIGTTSDIEPWQIRQASEAIQIYHFQFRHSNKSSFFNFDYTNTEAEALLNHLKKILILRHYAKTTEKTYLQWSRRFLSYFEITSKNSKPTKDDFKAFLTYLAINKNVSASTQNQI